MLLNIAVFKPLRRTFAYLPPQGVDIRSIQPGMRVRVPFRNKEEIAIILNIQTNSEIPLHKLKRAREIIDEAPILGEEMLNLCIFASDYYHAPIGEVFMAALPKVLRQGKSVGFKLPKIEKHQGLEKKLILSEEQKLAVHSVVTSLNQFNIFLLEGVTGSGKTEVYLQTIEAVLAQNQQALILVPEISLTPQILARFQARFAVPIVSLHSDQSDGKRMQAYLAAQNGKAKIIIGTRSAVFTPFANLGLIVIDEEHDHSFKQQSGFRYHARDLSIIRARNSHLPIMLGSATPSLETYLNVEKNRYRHILLRNRAANAALPTVNVVNMANTIIEEGLSENLHLAIRQHLTAGHQVLIFLNRRGYAPMLYCPNCQLVMQCKRCDANLVYHASTESLRCHHCEKTTLIPKHCPQCQISSLVAIGMGTQRIEQSLKKLFEAVPIIRIDRDNTQRKGELNALLKKMLEPGPAILLGTQMIAKGHHFPNVTLTCILEVDAGLLSADFRALEQVAQIIMQVGGRAGRGDKPGTVLIQSRFPEHPLLCLLLEKGYSDFAKRLLKEREQNELPPYRAHALFKAEAYDEKKAELFLNLIKTLSHDKAFATGIEMNGPYTPFLAKKKGLHAKHLLISSPRKNLQIYLKNIMPYLNKTNSQITKWILDVDPIEI